MAIKDKEKKLFVSPSKKSKTPKALPSKVASTPTSLSSLASKSISYKEVAVAPPGTVLKPLLEKTEAEKVSDENETSKTEGSIENSIADDTVSKEDEKEATHEDDSEQENSASELEKVSLSSDQAKPTETNGSKLSAAAKPFSPGTLSASLHLNPVPLATIYDANGSQGILVEPILPPAAARVPCGPRSPLYYRTNYTFRMKHGSAKIKGNKWIRRSKNNEPIYSLSLNQQNPLPQFTLPISILLFLIPSSLKPDPFLHPNQTLQPHPSNPFQSNPFPTLLNPKTHLTENTIYLRFHYQASRRHNLQSICYNSLRQSLFRDFQQQHPTTRHCQS